MGAGMVSLDPSTMYSSLCISKEWDKLRGDWVISNHVSEEEGTRVFD